MVIIDEQNYLVHYGTPRHSGRYPWGSGGNQDNTRNKDFTDYVNGLKRDGMKETEIAEGMGISTTELRKRQSIAATEKRHANISMAQRLADKGNSVAAISERMGVPNSTVRAWLAPGARDRAQVLNSTSKMLEDQVSQHKYVDIGSGVENYLNVSKEKLSTSVSLLENKGYVVHVVPVKQAGTGKETKIKVLCPPGTTWGEAAKNKDQITVPFNVKSDDGGRSYYGLLPPVKVDPSRVKVAWSEDGGGKADGVIYVRPNVPELSLGKARYAQVRVAIGDDHYMKGMAMYKDDLPNGVDLLFHTNKSNTGNKLDALKPITKDQDNPFGAIVDQIGDMKDGKLVKVTSAMNIVNEEGDWEKWSKSLASQVLSKQSPTLAKSQLDMTYEARQNEFASIKALTNSTVKKKLLEDFADGTDAASVHLKAAALPRQGWHAILPIETMPQSQIYAPNYNNGDLVALIRYPHGGTFEIPRLTVNNNHPEAKRLLGSSPRDAVGIHHSVAQRLSGADFDGDSVLVIPDNAGKITVTPALDGLKNFDHIATYPKYEGMRILEGTHKQIEMGKISNLITDMTIHKAPANEIAQAVRHSMVVIDAEKHELNWKQSYIDNGISELKKKYQPQGGAATIISRAKSPVYIPQTKPRPYKEGGPIDKLTGQKVYVPTGKTRINQKTGKPELVKMRIPALKLASDAGTLSSGTPMEALYVEHSNRLKALANTARLEAFKTQPSKKSPPAAKVYASEVKSLDAKLDLLQRNRPLERRAQLLTNATVRAKRDDDPNMDKATVKKIKFQALEENRTRTKASKAQIKITEAEWEAIQAGAISDSKLQQILTGADMKVVRELATPREAKLMTTTKTNRANAMLASGYTRAQVAAQLGVSMSTLDRSLTGTESGNG